MEYGHMVLARRQGNLLSTLNAFFTKGYFSHAFTTIAPAETLLAVEAEASGVTAGPFEKNYDWDPSRDFIMYSIQIPEEQKDDGLKYVLAKLETGYGYLQMPWFVWRWFCGLFGKDIKSQDNWGYSDGSLCSQLVADYLTAAGLGNLLTGFGQGSVSPNDLYQIALQNPQIFVEVKRKISNPNALK